MILLGQSAFLKALGWALLNSLWQFSVLWLVFMILIRQRKSLSPAVKHAFALAFLVAGFVWFGVGLSAEYFEYKSDGGASPPGIQFTTSAFYSGLYRSAAQFLESNLAYLSALYLIIVGGLFTRFSRYFYHAHTIQTKGISKLPADLRLYVQQLGQRLNINRKVHVWISELIDTPMVIGFLKPTILIPVASINHLSVKQLEAILLHELAHIRRNDYLVNLYMATMEVLFFFNPFSRLLLQSIKEEREKCCDDWVLQFNYDPHQYATALLRLEQNRPAMHHVAMAATGDSNKVLLHRIQRIMGVPRIESQHGFKLLAYFLSIALLCFIAFVNPGDMIIPKLSGEVSTVRVIHSPAFAAMNSAETKSTNMLKSEAVQVKPDEPKSGGSKPSARKEIIAPAETADEQDETDFSILAALDESAEVSAVVDAVHAEARDFTTPEPETPVVPLTTSETVMPFVPYSSFSYQAPADTSVHGFKAESYEERIARESLIKMQNALNKLDWDKIGKGLKKGKTDLIALREELEKSLQDLNWKQINKEVKDSLNKARIDDSRVSLAREYQVTNAYKNQQKKLEQVTSELRKQQELYRKDAEVKMNKIDAQIKKTKVIVYF